MCQRRQNSVRDLEVYGCWKFSGSLNPSIFPIPMAMSEYPEKSQ
jgi:hypothetical protein